MGGELRGLCSAPSRGLISINKANRLKPWPLLALPPLPPLPLAPDVGARLMGHPQAPGGAFAPHTEPPQGTPGARSLGKEKMATGPCPPEQGLPHTAAGKWGLLPSSGRAAGGARGWLAVGCAALLVPSVMPLAPMSTPAPWAGVCPTQTHGTAAFNTPTTGSHHGPSAGGDPTSSSPCIL